MLSTLLLVCAPLLSSGGRASDPFDAARAADPPARAALALAALRAHPELAPSELDSLWSLTQAELAALRLRAWEPVLVELHSRYQAPWSAVNLALVWQKLGRYADVNALLAATIRSEQRSGQATGGLVNQWGILCLGAGQEARARELLERAHALGSDDATCVLGRLELAQDRPRRARGRVRALMLSTEAPAWAQRTWGLSLLSARPSKTSERGAPPGDRTVPPSDR